MTIHWPAITSFGVGGPVPFLQNAPGLIGQIRRLADDFTFLNPHLTLVVDCLGEVTRIDATNPTWSKWKPSSPTSPH